MSTKKIIADAIALPVEERAIVADCLLRTLNPPNDVFDRKWVTAAKRRLHELRTGVVEAAPGDEVYSRIWKRFA